MDDAMKTLKLFYQNVRGIRTKTVEFCNNLLLLDSDIVLVTESWLCDGILDSELCDGRFTVFRSDRATLGGGVIVFCAPHLQARERLEWRCLDPECMWITIPAQALGSTRDLHIALVYIPPDGLLASRTRSFTNSLTQIHGSCPGDHFFIAGNFNLPCVKWTYEEPIVMKKGLVEVQHAASHLITQTNFLGLTQYNNLLNKSNNTLDLIFTDTPVTIQKSTLVLVKEDSAHPSFSISDTDILIPPLKPLSYTKRQFKRADFDSINDSLTKQDWSFILENNNIEDSINNFHIILNKLIHLFVPQVRCSGTYLYPIWYIDP